MWIHQETLLLCLVIIAGAVFFWRDALRAREAAVRVSRSACKSRDLQFLDDTVALTRLGVSRSEGGRLAFRRVYEFEFSTDGSRRYPGSVVLRGSHVESVFLPDVVT